MKGKKLAKSIALIFISTITACSSGSNSFEQQQEKTPVKNQVEPTSGDKDSADKPESTSPPARAEDSSGTGAPPVAGPESTVPSVPVAPDSTVPSVPVVPVADSYDHLKRKVAFTIKGSESGRGASVAEPDTLAGKPGWYVYSLGNDLMKLKETDKENTRLSALDYDETIFLNKENIDSNKVTTLNITDKGVTVGAYQLVKQTDSLYTTFLPQIPRVNEADPSDSSAYVALAGYIAQPTSDAEFSKLNGTANYTGKVIGYKYAFNVGDHHSFNDTSSKAKTRPTPAEANIQLVVNFDTKKITGTVTNRFDSLAARVIALRESENDRITAEGMTLNTVNMSLKGDIAKTGDIWGFRGPDAGGTGGVYIERKGKQVQIANWGGIFAGTNASEIVGGIENGEEKMSFGASKD